jgi:hypothetical protein
VHVRVDKTAPIVSITSPTIADLVDAGPVTIIGTVSDLLSGMSSVSCNGAPATLSSHDFACTVTVPAGTTTVTVSAADAAANVRTTTLGISTVEVVETSPPASLRVSPHEVTMLAGDTRTFAVLDDRGRIPPGVAWTVDDPTVALVEPGPPLIVRAMSAGEATLTASWGGLTATAQVRVRAAYGASEVVTLWSAPTVVSGGIKRIVRGMPTDAGPGRLYTWESADVPDPSNQIEASDLIRAYTPDGTEAWSVASSPAMRPAASSRWSRSRRPTRRSSSRSRPTARAAGPRWRSTGSRSIPMARSTTWPVRRCRASTLAPGPAVR